eukprot:1044798-Rhodomonas_salina.1
MHGQIIGKLPCSCHKLHLKCACLQLISRIRRRIRGPLVPGDCPLRLATPPIRPGSRIAVSTRGAMEIAVPRSVGRRALSSCVRGPVARNGARRQTAAHRVQIQYRQLHTRLVGDTAHRTKRTHAEEYEEDAVDSARYQGSHVSVPRFSVPRNQQYRLLTTVRKCSTNSSTDCSQQYQAGYLSMPK